MERVIKIAIITTDNRWPFGQYDKPAPWFGMAPEALLSGFAALPDEIEVHVVSCTRQPVKSPAKLAGNIFFHSVHVPKIGWMRTLYLGCILATWRKIKAIQPDIVHGQGTELDCAISAVFSGHPNVITLHGIMREQARLVCARPGSFYWLADRLENIALRRTAGVLCNSNYTEECVRSRTRRTWRMPNAIREEFFRPPVAPGPPDKCILLNVGVVCPRKRQNELLAVARELHEEGLNLEIHFLGQASDADPYGAKFLAAIRQSSPFASHLGFQPVDEIIQCFDHASALVHVPSEEAFGLVVAEALARNLKFFGFRVGGISEIAGGVEGAELMTDGNWGALKEAIRKWIRRGATRPTSAAAIMRERYHPVVIGRRHLEIYREVLERAERA